MNKEPSEILKLISISGMKAIISHCNSKIMNKSFIGREINEKLFGDQKEININMDGEMGEYHTLAVDGANFKQSIDYTILGVKKEGLFYNAIIR